jgi:hypothetical protein
MRDRSPESRPNLRDIVSAWLLCTLIAAFALGLYAALTPPRLSSPMTAGLQTAPRSRSTYPNHASQIQFYGRTTIYSDLPQLTVCGMRCRLNKHEAFDIVHRN